MAVPGTAQEEPGGRAGRGENQETPSQGLWARARTWRSLCPGVLAWSWPLAEVKSWQRTDVGRGLMPGAGQGTGAGTADGSGHVMADARIHAGRMLRDGRQGASRGQKTLDVHGLWPESLEREEDCRWGQEPGVWFAV